MNYPTREEFEELKEEVRQLKEQRTEEMKVTRIEVASEDVIKRLDNLKQDLNQELHTVSNTWLETLQEHYNDRTAHFEKIESTMATKQDLTALVEIMEERFKDLLIKYLRPGGNGQ